MLMILQVWQVLRDAPPDTKYSDDSHNVNHARDMYPAEEGSSHFG